MQCHLFPVICYLFSVVCYLSSVIGYLSSRAPHLSPAARAMLAPAGGRDVCGDEYSVIRRFGLMGYVF